MFQADGSRLWAMPLPGSIPLRRMVGDAPGMAMLWPAWPVRMRLSSLPQAVSMTRWWAFSTVPSAHRLGPHYEPVRPRGRHVPILSEAGTVAGTG